MVHRGVVGETAASYMMLPLQLAIAIQRKGSKDRLFEGRFLLQVFGRPVAVFLLSSLAWKDTIQTTF